MAAVMRGGARGPSKPRPKAKAATYAAPKPRPRKPVKSAKSAAASHPPPYNPAKLRAAERVGLSPKIAVGVAGAVLAAGLITALFTGERPQTVSGAVHTGFADQMAALGFRVKAVHVEGATPQAQADILRATGLYRDEPILGLDLNGLRAAVQKVGWVKQARVVRLLPDTLVLAVTQRPTVAVWQHDGAAHVIDDEGRVIAEADAGRFPDLPLVVGEGANDAAGAILPGLRERPQLMSRLEALVRVDNRRWDLRLKDGSLIQLPAVGEDSALIRLDQLDRDGRLLALGFARVDLRDPEMVAVRPREGASPTTPVSGGA